jgi:TATA-box binding protein (TBP) (component of TFIID and TFIIIB)
VKVSIKSIMLCAKVSPINIHKVLKKHTECYYDKNNCPSVFFDYGPTTVAVNSTGMIISNGATTEQQGILSITNTIKKITDSGLCDGVIEKNPKISGITCTIITGYDNLDLAKILKNNENARTNRAFHSIVLQLNNGETAQIYKNGIIVCVAIKNIAAITQCVNELKKIISDCSF